MKPNNIRLYLFILLLLFPLLFCTNFLYVHASQDSPKVIHGSGDDQSILDSIDETIEEQNENIDADIMNKGISKINSVIGVLLSVIIYLIFAFLGFTTACDLLYIGFPPLRPYLYSNNSQGNYQQQNGLPTSMYSNSTILNSNNSKGSKSICLISSELRQMMSFNNLDIKEYLKRRLISIIITVTILIILVSSTIFTDIGINIGQLIFDYICSLFGIE